MRKYFEKRFKLFGRAYLFRKRVHKNRPIELIRGECFNVLHIGRVSLLWARDNPSKPIPTNFVGD
jgi:hypothetical protein